MNPEEMADLQDILMKELRGSFEFFLDFTNLNPKSPGFGLTVDSNQKPRVASIATVGFALTAWTIAEARGYLPRARAVEITRGTLRTLLERASHYRGFFAHFLSMDNAQRVGKCEYSTIDTALCLNGAITAAAYFQDEEIEQLTQRLFDRIDWEFLIFEKGGKTLFKMAYNPDLDGKPAGNNHGFISQWDMAAEQKMMYLQAAPRVAPEMAMRLYEGFSRDTGEFEGQTIIINPGGSLFAYQYSELWLDTARYLDPDGIDWFNNTRLAALANRQFCIQHSKKYKTYNENSWGLSAGDSPHGYRVFGSPPCLQKPKHDGTVSIYSALACLPFIPAETRQMIAYLYAHQPQTWGPYGFYDAYNLDVSPAWYSRSLYGIDKGCSMISIENYLSGLVWETYTQSQAIQKALHILGFTERKGS